MLAISGVLVWCAALSGYDVRRRRLPNWLTLPGAAVILVGAVAAGRGVPALAGAGARALGGLLYGVPPLDPGAFAGAGAALAHFTGVQTELAVRPLYSGGVDYGQMIAALEEFGFVPNAFFANNKGHFPLLVEMDGLFVRRDLAGDGNIPIL